jgi:F-box protein 39
MEHCKWANLPDVVIIEIYKYLKDEEKLKAALTCKNWGWMYYTPCLWRTKHIDVGGYRVHYNGWRACQFATVHGRHVHNLSISCSRPPQHTAKIFQKTMEDLLFKMRQANLVEFEMEKLEIDRFWRYQSTGDRLVSNLVRFLRCQSRIKVFDMTTAKFPSIGGIRILETLGNRCGQTLKEMYIEDFFDSRNAIFQVPKYVTCLNLFRNLEFLSVNYSCLSEEIILLFARALPGILDMINIKISGQYPRSHRISGDAWRTLKKACPKLIVSLWFDNIGIRDEIVPLLSKEIPVCHFHIWTGYVDEEDWALNDTIRHLHQAYRQSLGI